MSDKQCSTLVQHKIVLCLIQRQTSSIGARFIKNNQQKHNSGLPFISLLIYHAASHRSYMQTSQFFIKYILLRYLCLRVGLTAATMGEYIITRCLS